MTQHEIGQFVATLLRELTRGEDGWPIAWCDGVWTSHRSNKGTTHEGTAVFDRDRCDVERARAFARDVEQRFRTAHPTLEPLELFVVPVTRLEVALAAVRAHFDDLATRDADRMRRGGERWVMLSEVAARTGWNVDEDRVVVEMYADSSADEGNAYRLGMEWLAELTARLPEIAGIVEVVGSSH